MDVDAYRELQKLWCSRPSMVGLYERPPANVSNDLFSSTRTTTFLILLASGEGPRFWPEGTPSARLDKAASVAILRKTILIASTLKRLRHRGYEDLRFPQSLYTSSGPQLRCSLP
jgi:hypothetical protein